MINKVLIFELPIAIWMQIAAARESSQLMIPELFALELYS